MSEEIDYEAQKLQHLKTMENKFQMFMDEWTNYKEEWKEWSDSGEELFWTKVLQIAFQEGGKLTNYYYDDTYYRCGDQYGEEYGLLSPIPESEFREKMREYAVANMGNYCHKRFLRSLDGCGIFYEGSSGNFDSYSINYNSIPLKGIEEKDIYTNEEFSEIIRKREEEKRLKAAQELAAVHARREQQEREQYEKLKTKFESK